jgi:starch-binding outer membrane protein SusE/F
MNTIKSYIAALAIVCTASACEKEGDKIILKGHGASELIATETDVVLTQTDDASLMLSLVWTSNELTLSDESVGIPTGVPAVTLQASALSDFANAYEVQQTTASITYTGAELNTLAKNAGLTPGVASPLYFRIQSVLGSNLEPAYSNVATVNVTPYQIDMSLLYVIDKAQVETLSTLYSPNSDGQYAGFMAATSWLNFYFREGDGKIYGNDGDSGTAFRLSNASNMWNAWFPGNNGCYYLNMSTITNEWSATLLPEITVGGDVSASLSFSTSQKLWSGTLTTTAANANITLSSAAKKYNIATGTDDAAAIATTINFAESQTGVLVMADVPGSITVPTAGTYTLKIDLTNPTQWTYTLTPGEDIGGEEEIPFLYLAGIDDEVTGPDWNFNQSIALLADGSYAGVVDANSKWGYKMYTTAAWADYYTKGTTDGSLVKNGEGNIPVPETATYLIKANTTNLTYSMQKLGDMVYLSGLNDVWNFNTTLAKTGNGIYSGNITVTVKSAWGFKVYIQSGNWDEVFGGSGGTLNYLGNGITDDAPGTYTLTVNLINGTYTMTPIQ